MKRHKLKLISIVLLLMMSSVVNAYSFYVECRLNSLSKIRVTPSTLRLYTNSYTAIGDKQCNILTDADGQYLELNLVSTDLYKVMNSECMNMAKIANLDETKNFRVKYLHDDTLGFNKIVHCFLENAVEPI